MKTLIYIFIIFLTSMGYTQSIKLKGVIKDSITLEPIPFAKIFFQGTKVGTESDFDGEFRLEGVVTNDTLTIRAIDYSEKKIFIDTKISKTQKFEFFLSSELQSIDEVLITAPDEKPSTVLHKKLVKHKKENNRDKLNAYEYESYNKIRLDLNNIGKDFEDSRVIKKLEIIGDFVQNDSAGKILPLLLSESFSNFYYRTGPTKTKEVILASRVTGIDNLDVTEFTGEMYQDINIYNNFLPIFGKAFISPASSTARVFYTFSLTDSSFIDNSWCYKLNFVPKKKGDLAFTGEMWVHDTTFAVKSWTGTIPKDANINFIKDFNIEQNLDQVSKHVWMVTREKLLIDFSVLKKGEAVGFYGRKLTTRKKFKINQPYDAKFYESNSDVALDENAKSRSEEFWESNRHEPLDKSESGIIKMTDSLNTKPYFRFLKNANYMLTTGFYPVGNFEIGNYQNVLNLNKVEGLRSQLELRTSKKFSKRLRLSGKIAYGSKDKRFKYGGVLQVNVTPKKRGILSLTYDKDLAQIGLSAANSSLGASLRRLLRKGPLNKLTFVEKVDLNFEKDLGKDFVLTTGASWKEFTPVNKNLFQRKTANGSLESINKIQSSELFVNLRYSKKEGFIGGPFKRKSTGRYPVFNLQGTFGVKGVLGSDYDYQKLEAHVTHKPKLGIFGKLKYNVYAGYVFGKSAYPFLKVHEGSQSRYLQSAAYNNMNFFEFISDKYVGAHIEHHFNGFILDRVPLIRKLQWRTIGNFRTVWGGISNRHTDEMILPANTKFFGNIPYVETGVGIGNIFKFIRIDAVWRLTHLDPKASPFTIKAKVEISF